MLRRRVGQSASTDALHRALYPGPGVNIQHPRTHITAKPTTPVVENHINHLAWPSVRRWVLGFSFPFQSRNIAMTAEEYNGPLEKGLGNAVAVGDSARATGPPDGGRKAWLTVLGSFFANMCSFGWSNCIGVFQAEYERALLSEYEPSEVAWITSTQCECASIEPLLSRR